MHSLTELKSFIESKHKKKPKEFDGILLVYPNVTFCLSSTMQDGNLVETWTAIKKKETKEFTAKELKSNLNNLFKR